MTGYIKRAEDFMKLITDSADLEEEEKQMVIDNYWTHWSAVCKYAAEHERIHYEARKAAGLINEFGKRGSCESQQSEKWYFVTIRPKNHISFRDLEAKIHKLCKRKFIMEMKYVYEQKGESDETLGQGHHFHAILKTTIRSGGEVANNVLSTMGNICGSSGVDVSRSYNWEEHFQRYCGEHRSKDLHKEKTKEWDDKWRKLIGLQEVYHVSPKPSPVGDTNGVPIDGPEQKVTISHEPRIESWD